MDKKVAQKLGQLGILVVLTLERTCELLDQIPKFTRIPTWNKADGTLWRIQPSKLGCKLGLTKASKALDRRWGTGQWE